MSYKESKDKTDRACRDAVRKVDKKKQQEETTAATMIARRTKPAPSELTPDSVFAEQSPTPLLSTMISSPQQAYRTNPGLEHSCGSLIFDTDSSAGARRGNAALENGPRRGSITLTQIDSFGGGTTMEMSNLSLDFFKNEDEGADEGSDEKKIEEEDESSIELSMGHYQQQRQQQVQQQRLADSCMSLDLLSLETPPQQVRSTNMDQPPRETSDVTLKTGTVARQQRQSITEDMLVESFSKSMDLIRS